MIQEDSLVAVVPDQVACEMQEELVILQTATGVYFGLDPMAKRVWSLMSAPKRVGNIRDQLLDEFDVDSGTCTRDLLTFLEELERKRLIQVNYAPMD
jgi:hypothetical protein